MCCRPDLTRSMNSAASIGYTRVHGAADRASISGGGVYESAHERAATAIYRSSLSAVSLSVVTIRLFSWTGTADHGLRQLNFAGAIPMVITTISSFEKFPKKFANFDLPGSTREGSS
jgi:hypothetical protein